MPLLEKDQIGKRELLLDVMVFADFRKTPVFSRIKKSKELTNTLFEWNMDAYRNPETESVVDGTDHTDWNNHAEQRAQARNHIHYLRTGYKVSPLAENVSVVAGVSSEEAEAKRKMVIEMARDVEAVLTGAQEARADDGAVGYRTRGLDKWIQATAQDYLPVPEIHRPTASQIKTTAAASLSEENDIQSILQAVYDATGMNGDFVFLCGSVMRRALTTSTRIITGNTNNYYTVRSFNPSGNKIEQTTTAYAGDFGTLQVEVSQWLRFDNDTKQPDTDAAFFVDFSKLSLRYGRLPQIRTLEDRGSGTPILGESWFGLQCTTPRGMAKIVPA